jgi:hypothetical protein
MDVSTVERWLKVAFYGMPALNRPSFQGPNTSTRSVTTRTTTATAARRAEESRGVCTREVQFGEEKPFAGGGPDASKP